ncbi:MAG: pyruvate, phosphate dikinase [Planctomycetes bacterium]|nr:pyruvate, phosphate dikinase [Planctomycetota bacterium]NOG53111.1 pyruvate, phosphate dikinase [Planctomycetota bacterium]
MPTSDDSIKQILQSLQERAKELNCLYRVDEILNRRDQPPENVFQQLIEAIPPGWQYPEVCRAKVVVNGQSYTPADFTATEWMQCADISIEGEAVGDLTVCYTEKRPAESEGPFLLEERRLINAIVERIGLYIMQSRLRVAHASLHQALEAPTTAQPWGILLEFLQRTDPRLLNRITRKMINNLCWHGVTDAEPLLQTHLGQTRSREDEQPDENRPMERWQLLDESDLTRRTFDIAAENLNEAEIVQCIQEWINEEKSTVLIKSLENPGTGLAELSEAVERFESAGIDESALPIAVQTSLKVALLRRFFVDSLDFINVAKNFVAVRDFYELTQRVIHPARSQGKLGGKGAGLFLATQILKRSTDNTNLLSNLKTPRTWYVASDGVLDFIHYNNLEELYNTKYMEIERVRQDYPHVVQVFKNSRFTSDVLKGLATALDDFDNRPIIVRSSSLLEDRAGAAFSGKYKSLFLANQGTKEQRLAALQDAIAEVYASIFSPDPIEYRAERNLLDFREEMGILIQEVVGRRVGHYFLPACAGVAFSNNEYRWSPRIHREDGLVRLVPGLGTRAVDRMSDDYPVLLAPGQPGLRANATADEVVRYSPKHIDVINLKTNSFETIDVEQLLREYGDEYPAVRQVISMVDQDRIRPPLPLEPDWSHDDFVITFEGLIGEGRLVQQLGAMLNLLRDKIGMPVDIEFAHDGEDLYLVQCRAQSYSNEDAPAPIPQDIPRDRLIFSANRHISNGRVADITHIVYVNAARYSEISDIQHLRSVGRAVSRLNQVLPKRQFVLIGPGRWGSRGDIRLGVSVTYSDINNAAVLIEVARQKGNYIPELSFGTHFFQDLVEAGIRYLPLYPDDGGIVFNEAFLTHSQNILPGLVPEYSHLADTIHVIDVPEQTGGLVLRVLMNADLEQAAGLLDEPGLPVGPVSPPTRPGGQVTEQHWRWRLRMAEQIARLVDVTRFGVKAIYIIGSTKNATAGPASDIDLIIHDAGDERQRHLLATWLDGWSGSLAETNYLRTGYRTDGLLDVHYVTDQDIADQSSFASKIGAVTDAAKQLAISSAS